MSERFDRAAGIFYFVAMMGTGIALGGALAHLLEMPNKLGMDRSDYLATQGAYRGWALLAIVLVVQAIGLIGLALRAPEGSPTSCRPAPRLPLLSWRRWCSGSIRFQPTRRLTSGRCCQTTGRP
ncbi:hypothetical protein [Devosia nitrariae]|uniref:hypothetical protein n=1 Tax=Devosia nitrariae TaxID=2071872 RepID=UPI0024E13B58|nr:hypothetical protein [Devosia nitrariae]